MNVVYIYIVLHMQIQYTDTYIYSVHNTNIRIYILMNLEAFRGSVSNRSHLTVHFGGRASCRDTKQKTEREHVL